MGEKWLVQWVLSTDGLFASETLIQWMIEKDDMGWYRSCILNVKIGSWMIKKIISFLCIKHGYKYTFHGEG